MNNLKKTIMTFVAISSLSVGTAMATSDVAGQVENWYKNAFQESTESTTQTTEEGLIKIENTTKKHQIMEMEAAASKIESFFQTTIGQSKSSIESYQKNYQSRLIKAQTKLEESNFNEFAESEKIKLNSEITDDVEEMLADVLGE